MARSLKKGFFVPEKLQKKIDRMNQAGDKKVIKTRYRNSHITPDMIGYTLAVHNGKTFVSVFVTEEMMWHKLGEFVPTRTFRGHPF